MTDLWRRGRTQPRRTLDGRARCGPTDSRAGATPAEIASRSAAETPGRAPPWAVADIAGAWPLDRITGQLSEFASAACAPLTDAILLQLERDGQLSSAENPGAAAFTVLAWASSVPGTNYSSDIDLILFLTTSDAPALAGNEQLSRHFVRAARLLVQLMSETSAEGYIFRTDQRLRPDRAPRPSPCRCRRPISITERRPELGTRGDDQGTSSGRQRDRGRRPSSPT